MKNKFLDLLNSKPVIGALIFVMLSLATVFAGDVIVKEGELIIEESLNVGEVFFVDAENNKVGIGVTNPILELDVGGKIRAEDFILKYSLEEEILSINNFIDFEIDEIITEDGQSMKETLVLLFEINKQLLGRVEILENELCRLKKKKEDYSWCGDELKPDKKKDNKFEDNEKPKNKNSTINLTDQNKTN